MASRKKMRKSHTFKFLDNDLNQKFIGLVKKADIEHRIDHNGLVRYAASDEEHVENDLICSIRDAVFPSWQVLTCPSDWTTRYKHYLSCHSIPFSGGIEQR